MDNSTGHYQDNRAEYFWDHNPDLIRMNVVGYLFGWGERQQTSNWDALRGNPRTRDGITNGTPFCTTDVVSSGEVCNTHISTVADDDGGYLRTRATEYYQNPFILPNP